MGYYKVISKADNFPESPRIMPIEGGVAVFVLTSEKMQVGSKFKDYDAIVSKVFYEPKRWWQFWKRKKILGYQVIWQ